MIKRKVLLILGVLILLINMYLASSYLPPSLPVKIKGKVVDSEGNGIPDQEVTASWMSSSGDTKTRSIRTYKSDELLGYYSIEIDAIEGSIVELESGNANVNVIAVVGIPIQAENLIIKEGVINNIIDYLGDLLGLDDKKEPQIKNETKEDSDSDSDKNSQQTDIDNIGEEEKIDSEFPLNQSQLDNKENDLANDSINLSNRTMSDETAESKNKTDTENNPDNTPSFKMPSINGSSNYTKEDTYEYKEGFINSLLSFNSDFFSRYSISYEKEGNGIKRFFSFLGEYTSSVLVFTDRYVNRISRNTDTEEVTIENEVELNSMKTSEIKDAVSGNVADKDNLSVISLILTITALLFCAIAIFMFSRYLMKRKMLENAILRRKFFSYKNKQFKYVL